MTTNYPFRGVFIPAHVWTRRDISWEEKCLIATIDLFSDSTGVCSEPDEYLSRKMGMNILELTTAITHLGTVGALKIAHDGDQRYLAIGSGDFPAPPRKLSEPRAGDSEVRTVANLYHEICPTMPKVTKINLSRRRAVGILLKRNIPAAELFRKAHASDFLSGRSAKWHACDFDWLTQPDNALRVMEGRYDNPAAAKTAPTRTVIPENLRG